MTSKIFETTIAKRKFVQLYETLSEPGKSDFGAAIRKRAEEKVLRLDDIGEFYLTEDDVIEVYEALTEPEM